MPPAEIFDPNDRSAPVGSVPAEPAWVGADYYQPPAGGPSDQPADDDGDEGFDEPRLTPARMLIAAVAVAAVVALGLFLFTFTGSSGPGSSGAAPIVPVAVSSATSAAATTPHRSPATATPSGRATPAPTRPRSAGAPSSSPLVSTPHTSAPVTPLGPPPRSSTAPQTSASPQPTVAQLLIAGNAENFFHAVAGGDLGVICGLWDPSAMAAYVQRVGAGSCPGLDPSGLASPTERHDDAGFTADPNTVVIQGDDATIPAAATSTTPKAELRLVGGLWRVVYNGPTTPVDPITTPPAGTPVPTQPDLFPSEGH